MGHGTHTLLLLVLPGIVRVHVRVCVHGRRAGATRTCAFAALSSDSQ